MPFVADSKILTLFTSKPHLFPFFLIPLFIWMILKKKKNKSSDHNREKLY